MLFVLLVAVAGALRWWHLGRPSLWWDEIVHIHSAARPSLAEVWTTVRAGIPPGFGNAGAVPLDYLLLHAWTRIVPTPDPTGLELYYRVPSFVWSTAAVGVTFAWARRFLDRTVAFFAGLLLALSLPHVLYAAEARAYSLFSLATVLDLWVFSRLVVRLVRGERGGWILFTVAGGLLFLTGLPGLFLLAVQYAILAVLALRELARGHGRPLAELAASATLVALLVLAYYWDTLLWASYGRGRQLAVWPLTEHAVTTFAYRSRLLLWCFVAALPATLIDGRRRGKGRLAIAIYLVASFLAIPALILLAQEKEYYFHFRHALFLLPHFAIVTATGLALVFRAIAGPLALSERVREASVAVAGIALLLAAQVPTVAAYVVRPVPFFSESKTLRDLRGLAVQLERRLAALAPDEKYLLVVERRRPGHLANPSLVEYLGWYGLADRIVLRGTDRPEETLAALTKLCATGCRGRDVFSLPHELNLPPPLGIRPEMKRLLGFPIVETASEAPLGGIGMVYWGRKAVRPPKRFRGYDVTPRQGLTLYDLRELSRPAAVG